MSPTGGTAPPEAKAYHGAHLTITFDAARCLHAAECVRGLPHVFDAKARPWIRPDAAAARDLIDVIHRCPSGALQYTPNDDNFEPESGTQPAAVIRSPAGRLYVHGEVI